MALGARKKDPYLGFNFIVEIEGMVVGGFNEVSGLNVEVEVTPVREGGRNEFMYQLPGPAKYPSNLVLKRGLTDDRSLWDWHRDVVDGYIERKNGSVVLRDSTGQEKWRWNFLSAYPVKWSGPSLKGSPAEVAIEVLELVHHGLVKA